MVKTQSSMFPGSLILVVYSRKPANYWYHCLRSMNLKVSYFFCLFEFQVVPWHSAVIYGAVHLSSCRTEYLFRNISATRGECRIFWKNWQHGHIRTVSNNWLKSRLGWHLKVWFMSVHRITRDSVLLKSGLDNQLILSWSHKSLTAWEDD